MVPPPLAPLPLTAQTRKQATHLKPPLWSQQGINQFSLRLRAVWWSFSCDGGQRDVMTLLFEAVLPAKVGRQGLGEPVDTWTCEGRAGSAAQMSSWDMSSGVDSALGLPAYRRVSQSPTCISSKTDIGGPGTLHGHPLIHLSSASPPPTLPTRHTYFTLTFLLVLDLCFPINRGQTEPLLHEGSSFIHAWAYCSSNPGGAESVP